MNIKSTIKIFSVIIGATVITALGIDAADTLSGSRSTLLSQLIGSEAGGCPSGMIEVQSSDSFACVDKYEVSPSEGCLVKNPKNTQDTNNNINNKECQAIAQEKGLPWRFVSRDQASALCLKAGKRLPNNQEWQIFSLGTPDDDSCNVDTNGVVESGSLDSCKSAVGAYDTVGNVWEWTSDEVVSGKLNNRDLPPTGYVSSADKSGVAVLTDTTGNDLYGNDYFWSNLNSVWAVMRGGYYGSGEDAGIYSVHADIPGDMVGDAIGFRCVL